MKHWDSMSGCEGKDAFALKVAKRPRLKKKPSLEPYRCEFCGKWHIGGTKKKWRRSTDRRRKAKGWD